MDEKSSCGIQPCGSKSESPTKSFEAPSLNLDHRLFPPPTDSNPDPTHSPSSDEDYYDAVLLYCDKDTEMAESIVDKMNEVELDDGIMAKVELYELVHITEVEKFARLGKVLSTCSYVFVLCTDNFKQDDLTRYLADECVMNSIMNKDKKQPWQVVPVVDQPEKVGNLPMGLNSLTPIKWGTKYALERVRRLLMKGVRRNLVRSQSLSSMISSFGIQESSLHRENKDTSLSSSKSVGNISSKTPVEHKDPSSMTTSPLPSTEKSLGECESKKE